MLDRLPRRVLLLWGLAALATPAAARARNYVLSTGRSTISFSFRLSGSPQTGTMPIASADIQIDPDNLAASKARVSADVRGAKTGLIFATQALKSPSVLDADAHPMVKYVTTRIILDKSGRIFDGAMVDGQLTLRGVTRPLRLNARLTRPQGTAPDDLSLLNVRLTGSLSRADFGATGYSELVADRVDLDIRAEIAESG